MTGIGHRQLTPGVFRQLAVRFSPWTSSLVEGFGSKATVGVFQSLISAVQEENIWISSGNKRRAKHKLFRGTEAV